MSVSLTRLPGAGQELVKKKRWCWWSQKGSGCQASCHFTVFSFHQQGLVHFRKQISLTRMLTRRLQLIDQPQVLAAVLFPSGSWMSRSTRLHCLETGVAIQGPVYMCLVSSWRCTLSPEVFLRAPGIMCRGLLKQGWSSVCISSSNFKDVGRKNYACFFVTTFLFVIFRDKILRHSQGIDWRMSRLEPCSNYKHPMGLKYFCTVFRGAVFLEKLPLFAHFDGFVLKRNVSWREVLNVKNFCDSLMKKHIKWLKAEVGLDVRWTLFLPDVFRSLEFDHLY